MKTYETVVKKSFVTRPLFVKKGGTPFIVQESVFYFFGVFGVCFL